MVQIMPHSAWRAADCNGGKEDSGMLSAHEAANPGYTPVVIGAPAGARDGAGRWNWHNVQPCNRTCTSGRHACKAAAPPRAVHAAGYGSCSPSGLPLEAECQQKVAHQQS